MDEQLRITVLSIVSRRMKTASAEEIAEAVDRAREYFLNVTNRSYVPDRGKYLWADMAAEVYLKTFGEAGTQGGIKAVKVGDTTVEYQNEASLNTILRGFNGSLNHFKRTRMR